MQVVLPADNLNEESLTSNRVGSFFSPTFKCSILKISVIRI